MGARTGAPSTGARITPPGAQQACALLANAMAACANAPMCQIDDKAYHVDLTPEKVDELLKTLGVEVENHG